MTIQLSNSNIERVQLVDDEPSVRISYHDAVEEINLQPIEVTGPVADMPNLIASFDAHRDAVICDFNLKTKNYSSFNGDELAASLYTKKFPVVLCTRFAGGHHPQIRAKRRMIPVILGANELSGEALTAAFNVCAEEFRGNFSVPRRPWRSLVRVEGGEVLANNQLRLNVVVSSWDPGTGLSFDIPMTQNPALKYIKECIERGDIARVYAMVNVGTERPDDVYLDGWEMP